MASFSLTVSRPHDLPQDRTDRGLRNHIAPIIAAPVERLSAGQVDPDHQSAARPIDAAFLLLQNSVRAHVGAQPLVWSDRLADAAQQWANHLVTTGAFRHHVGGGYGENLYEIIGGKATPHDVVAAWADERRAYDLQTNSCSAGVDCGHYTQIVWATTHAVGCALAADPSRQIWVCEYYPAGNIIGYRPY
ncbi:MAG: hypothetical protein KGI51_14335 [Rhodospirillales bacterium]|nr:hypothetical protein [Rhodospirillales bacterium]